MYYNNIAVKIIGANGPYTIIEPVDPSVWFGDFGYKMVYRSQLSACPTNETSSQQQIKEQPAWQREGFDNAFDYADRPMNNGRSYGIN